MVFFNPEAKVGRLNDEMVRSFNLFLFFRMHLVILQVLIALHAPATCKPYGHVISNQSTMWAMNPQPTPFYVLENTPPLKRKVVLTGMMSIDRPQISLSVTSIFLAGSQSCRRKRRCPAIAQLLAI